VIQSYTQQLLSRVSVAPRCKTDKFFLTRNCGTSTCIMGEQEDRPNLKKMMLLDLRSTIDRNTPSQAQVFFFDCVHS